MIVFSYPTIRGRGEFLLKDDGVRGCRNKEANGTNFEVGVLQLGSLIPKKDTVTIKILLLRF